MLHHFIVKNQEDLLKRCLAKAIKRNSAQVIPLIPLTEPAHGVPAVLSQIVQALVFKEANPGKELQEAPGSSTLEESRRSATLHGRALLKSGYTVDQVVHGYGDVCQAITELASEKKEQVTPSEFHTLNLVLDIAIANAVTSYTQQRGTDGNVANEVNERIGTLADELRMHVEVATNAMNALKVGKIGINGSTGTVLAASLLNLRDLIDKSIPEIRLATGMTVPSKRKHN